jgi:hypothetical protein
MRTTFGHAIWVTVIGVSALLGACGDDDNGGPNGTNGGEAAGGDTSSTAGTGGGGKAGSASVEAGAGGTAQGGAPTGAAGEGEPVGGAGGAAEAGGAGGAPDAMGGAGGAAEAGAGGMGDGGAPPVALEYACTANTINHKLCSAYAAAACSPAVDCATCVAERKGERDLYADCSTCAAEFDKVFQCGIDAFESGNLASGVECVAGHGADLTFDCYEHWESAMNCSEYAVENPCPETWPLD